MAPDVSTEARRSQIQRSPEVPIRARGRSCAWMAGSRDPANQIARFWCDLIAVAVRDWEGGRCDQGAIREAHHPRICERTC
eukprot:4146242-Alexandrium_andersonii.AAC.1